MGKTPFIKRDTTGRSPSLVLPIGKCSCDIADLYTASVLYARDQLVDIFVKKGKTSVTSAEKWHWSVAEHHWDQARQ